MVRYFTPELKALLADVKAILGFDMTMVECASLLSLIQKRHRVSHTNITKQKTEEEVRDLIAKAKKLCKEEWLDDLEYSKSLVGRVINHYDRLVAGGFEGKRQELWREGRFTGHI